MILGMVFVIADNILQKTHSSGNRTCQKSLAVWMQVSSLEEGGKGREFSPMNKSGAMPLGLRAQELLYVARNILFKRLKIKSSDKMKRRQTTQLRLVRESYKVSRGKEG